MFNSFSFPLLLSVCLLDDPNAIVFPRKIEEPIRTTKNELKSLKKMHSKN